MEHIYRKPTGPTTMCDICKAIPFHHLPSIEEDGLPHHPTFAALADSAQNCPLCSLLCFALECSLARVGGSITFTPPATLPSGKKYSSEWEGSMSRRGMRAMENGAVSFDFSPMKANLDPPRRADVREYIEDDSKVRPWLFGSWYDSPFGHTPAWLVGLGVRLGRGPRFEDAVGLVDTPQGESGNLKIRVPGTSLRIRTDETANIAAIVPGRLRTEDQSSRRAISRVKKWKYVCDYGHQCAKGHSCSSDVESQSLPTRVLDVCVKRPNGTLGIRLMEPKDIRAHYIALSHCWGTSPRLTTLKTNLKAHMEDIPFDALAKTFQDAIVIARELDIRYIWIDSLCIIQDDYADWEREAVRMGAVYSLAYLTISALSSKDDSDGIFSDLRQRTTGSLVSLDTISTGRRSLHWPAPFLSQHGAPGEEITTYRAKTYFGVCDTSGRPNGRDPPRIYVTPEWMPASTKPNQNTKPDSGTTNEKSDVDNGRAKSTETYLIGEFGGNVDPFADEPLSKRGWTLQERILSRRTLHYGSDEMYWECQGFVLAEDGAMMRRSFPSRHEVLSGRSGVFQSDDSDEQSESKKGRNAWYQLVEEYCARDLTRSEDKLPALAGLASTIALGSGDAYVAGLWRSDILDGLNWSVEVHEPSHQCDDPEHDAALPPATKSFPAHPIEYRAPSWSWAAFDAKVKFHSSHNRRTMGRTVAEVVEVRVHNAGSDSFGKVTGGWIELKAPLYTIRDNSKKDVSPHRANQKVFTQSIQFVSKIDGVKSGSAVFDDTIQLPCFAVALSEESAILLEAYTPEGLARDTADQQDGLLAFKRIGRASYGENWQPNVSESPDLITEGTSSNFPVDDKSSKSPSLSRRFVHISLSEHKSNESRKILDVGLNEFQQLAQSTSDSQLWMMADGSTRTVRLY